MSNVETFGESDAEDEHPTGFRFTKDEDESDERPVDEVVQRDLLRELEATLGTDVQKPPITLAVEGRPGVSLVYRTNIESPEIQGWRRKARIKGTGNRDEVDSSKFSAAIIWNANESLRMHGRDMGMTIRSKEVQRMVNALDVVSTVRTFFGDDAHMLAHAMKIIGAAGYDEEGMELDAEEDPTKT